MNMMLYKQLLFMSPKVYAFATQRPTKGMNPQIFTFFLCSGVAPLYSRQYIKLKQLLQEYKYLQPTEVSSEIVREATFMNFQSFQDALKKMRNCRQVVIKWKGLAAAQSLSGVGFRSGGVGRRRRFPSSPSSQKCGKTRPFQFPCWMTATNASTADTLSGKVDR